MNFFIAFGMFFCYGIGCAVSSTVRAAGHPWFAAFMSLPFEVGAYVILASQVGLHW